MKLRTVLAVLALVLVAMPVPAQAGWLEFFFPSLRKPEYDPTQTMRAPFAAEDKSAAEAGPPKPVIPEDATPVDQPHKNTNEIGAWLVMAVSEAVTFKDDDYHQELARTESYFDTEGRAQYKAFLDDVGLAKILESGQYRVHGFVEEQPLLLNEGAVDGRYRWLFEVPVMVSTMDRSMKGYEGQAAALSQQMTVTVQLGRDPDVDNVDNKAKILIERWGAKIRKSGKK